MNERLLNEIEKITEHMTLGHDLSEEIRLRIEAHNAPLGEEGMDDTLKYLGQIFVQANLARDVAWRLIKDLSGLDH